MRRSAVEELSAWASVLATMKSTPWTSAQHHVGDGVAAGAADSDDADPRAKLVDFRPDEIDAHDLIPLNQGKVLNLQGESLNHRESQAKRKS